MDSDPLGPQGVAIGNESEGMQWLGYETEPVIAPEPVHHAGIRLFCELVEDANPVYWDDGFGNVDVRDTAPPGTLMTWCMPRTWDPASGETVAPALQRQVPLPGDVVLATRSVTTYHQPMRVGTRLQYRQRLKSLTPKETRLGKGHFLVVAQDYADQNDEPVATSELTILRYASSNVNTESRGASVFNSKPDLGGSLGSVTYPVTYRKCVISTAATRDFNPVHYDREHINNSSAPDVFINTMTYQGLFGRLIGQCVGHEAVITEIDMTMTGMNIPGDVLTLEAFEGENKAGQRPDEKWVHVLGMNDRTGVTTRARVNYIYRE